jgi:SAM-dependent methyltransferase
MIFISSLRKKLRILKGLIDQGENPVRFTKFVPGKAQGQDLVLSLDSRAKGPGLPVPPAALRIGYGHDDASYVESGRRDVERMLLAIADAAPGFCPDAQPILDLGCGAGRMIRHLEAFAARTEVWGLDVSSPHINWLKTHLSPPFGFAVNTTLPHLTFSDGYFGLIYCGSVFTHIDDLAESWFLEARRALRPGGVLYCTVHDEHTLEALRLEPGHPLAAVVARQPNLSGDHPADVVVVGNDVDSNVFYSGSYLRGLLGRMFEVLAVVPRAYGYQTGWILRKR